MVTGVLVLFVFFRVVDALDASRRMQKKTNGCILIPSMVNCCCNDIDMDHHTFRVLFPVGYTCSVVGSDPVDSNFHLYVWTQCTVFPKYSDFKYRSACWFCFVVSCL